MKPSLSDASFSPEILLKCYVVHPLVAKTTKVSLHLRADLPLSIFNNGGFQIDSQAVLPEADRIDVFVGTDQEDHIRVAHHVAVLLVVVGDDTSGPRPVLPMISTQAAMKEPLLFHLLMVPHLPQPLRELAEDGGRFVVEVLHYFAPLLAEPSFCDSG